VREWSGITAMRPVELEAEAALCDFPALRSRAQVRVRERHSSQSHRKLQRSGHTTRSLHSFVDEAATLCQAAPKTTFCV
jgi:hypothetical protein